MNCHEIIQKVDIHFTEKIVFENENTFTEPPGDVIVFLTGMDEVDHCVQLLKEHARNEDQTKNKHGLKIWALPMYGSLPPQDQLKVFRPGGRGTRKIVVATNIAETSITIDGVAYVVDSCFVKMKWYNPESNVDALIITEISQASGQQRYIVTFLHKILIQRRWSLMRKGAHLRTLYFSLNVGKGRFCAPKF